MRFSSRDSAVGEVITRLMSDRWTVSMATAHTGFPETKLKTDNIYDAAVAWGQRRSKAYIHGSSCDCVFRGMEDSRDI